MGKKKGRSFFKILGSALQFQAADKREESERVRERERCARHYTCSVTSSEARQMRFVRMLRERLDSESCIYRRRKRD